MTVRRSDGWTRSGDLSIENSVQEKIDLVTDAIKVHFDPESIFIHGSFSHGEGSVYKLDDEFVFLGDFDISYVYKKKQSRKTVNELSKKLTKKLGFPINIYQNSKDKYKASTFWSLDHGIDQPSVEGFSIKHGSRVLYGRDYLQQLPDYRSDKIPVWEGMKLIFNRMGETLGFIEEGFGKSSKRDTILQTYEIYKLLLATLEAILLSEKKYHYSYEQQLNLFFKEEKSFNEIIKNCSEYKSLVTKAVEFKLRPDKSDLNVNKLYYEAMEACDIVIRFIVRKLLSFDFTSYSDFQKKYLSNKEIKNYYLGPTSNVVFQNSMLLLNIFKKKRTVPLRFFLNFHRSLNHLIVSTVIVIFFAQPKPGKVNSTLIKLVRNNLSYFFNLGNIESKAKDELMYVRRKSNEIWSRCYI